MVVVVVVAVAVVVDDVVVVVVIAVVVVVPAVVVATILMIVPTGLSHGQRRQCMPMPSHRLTLHRLNASPGLFLDSL